MMKNYYYVSTMDYENMLYILDEITVDELIKDYYRTNEEIEKLNKIKEELE